MSAKFCANENFPGMIVRWLRASGHDVLYAAEDYVGAADDQILRVANDDQRIVLTFDRDFGELVFHHQEWVAGGIVLFRIPQESAELMLLLIRSFFESSPPLLGFFTVVTPGRFRQAPLREYV
ncbi:MAG: DUF5615 family PIN-like protein [Dongiaceae bacterium]